MRKERFLSAPGTLVGARSVALPSEHIGNYGNNNAGAARPLRGAPAAQTVRNPRDHGPDARRRPAPQVLGLARDASLADVRRRYAELAFALHPAKSPLTGDAAALAEVQEAYAVMGEPALRARYDAGGFAAVAAAAAADAMEVDLSKLGAVSSALTGLLSRLGAPVRAALPPALLTAAAAGRLAGEPLNFGEPAAARCERRGAWRLFELSLEQVHLDRGFLVAVQAPAGSRFKVVLLTPADSGDGGDGSGGGRRWEVAAVEEAAPLARRAVAAVLALAFPSHALDPVPQLELDADPRAALFGRLERLRRRRAPRLRAGPALVAVVSDHWVHALRFVAEAALASGGARGAAAAAVQGAEAEMLRRGPGLYDLERRVRRAEEEYRAALTAYGEQAWDVEALAARREDAYAELLGVADDAGAGAAEPAPADRRAGVTAVLRAASPRKARGAAARLGRALGIN